jgi:pimeloyl-ACP methyl ester carboxylesterase
MTRSLACSTVVTLSGGHDVHLDAPEAWRSTVSDFLLRLS